MIKYKDNESYERDKAALIRIAQSNSMFNFRENADVFADLLKQSKWIGADETLLTEKPPETLKGGFFWDDDDEDSDFYLI